MNEALHDMAQKAPRVISHAEINGLEQSIPVALDIINPTVVHILRTEADKADVSDVNKASYCETAAYLEVAHSFWRACDETGIQRHARIRLLKDVKRFFLRGIEDWLKIPRYVHGLVRGTWVQLLASIDNMLYALDEQWIRTHHAIDWMHHRAFNQDAVEMFFSLLSKHRTAKLIELRFAWIVYEQGKLFDSSPNYHQPVSRRKARIATDQDRMANPHLDLSGDLRRGRKRALGGKQLNRCFGDPARRGDHGWVRSSCRQRYAPVESSIAHHLREVVYDIYTSVNQDGRRILMQNSEESYEQISEESYEQSCDHQ